MRGLAFVSAVISLVAVFAGVGSTIPLFNVYRAEDGFTNAGIAIAVVAYSAATLVTLLILGRLSGHLGRRPIAIASLVLLVLGCGLLLNVHDIGILIAARVLMGFGAGLASSSLTAYIVDAAPARPTWLASVASSQTVMLGLAIGAIGSGALIQFAPWPRDLTLLAVIGLLLASVALIALSPETADPMPGAWRSLRPSVRVAPGSGPCFPSPPRSCWPRGRRAPSTRRSCPRSSRINSIPAVPSSWGWCSPRTWRPAHWALRSAVGSRPRERNASAWRPSSPDGSV
ncbi:hypothetical protein GCM10025881_16780 [Pseudolysinimonas kribbensis]|uniref:Major facilitator superfamily (MFS) profile domain-containing protein n=2 Tax=Pseudolysinimonas kribbensis TaxID=433641 RepID=A0ABQ6K5Z6_9MICO|nr:hypothetical protein GCM10025881_16780 [Pseudolysinimonas kribbensis]